MILPFYFLLRRLILSFILVVFEGKLIIQIILGIASVIGGVLINGFIDGYDSVFRRRLEYFGEIIFLTMIYSMMCFTPFLDLNARVIVGYLIILIVSINISFYLVLMTY